MSEIKSRKKPTKVWKSLQQPKLHCVWALKKLFYTHRQIGPGPANDEYLSPGSNSAIG